MDTPTYIKSLEDQIADLNKKLSESEKSLEKYHGIDCGWIRHEKYNNIMFSFGNRIIASIGDFSKTTQCAVIKKSGIIIGEDVTELSTRQEAMDYVIKKLKASKNKNIKK